MASGEQIVLAARGWLGTRFQHQGRLKKNASHKGGVDCLGLLMGVASELRLYSPDGVPLSDRDEINYPRFPDPDYLKKQLSRAMNMVPIADIAAGDVVLFSIEDNPQHMAFASNLACGRGIIHAYAPAKAVVEHPLDEWWRQRIVSAYRVL